MDKLVHVQKPSDQLKTPSSHRSGSQAGLLSWLLILLLFILSACATNSGVLSSSNWQASGLQDQHPQVLAVDPHHLRNVYAGDAQAGIFVSNDAGLHWRTASTGLPLPLAINALSFDTPGQKLYAATSAGLFVSSDAAATWHQVPDLPAGAYTALAFDVNMPRVIYAATARADVLLSRDSGSTWTHTGRVLAAGALTSMLYDANLQELWVACADSLYRSSDNGATWQAMNTGLPPHVGINTLALGAILGDTSDLLFVGTDHGFFLSRDAGQHWAQSQFSLAALNVHAILLDATQPNIVYASTTIGVLRSSDNGQNWNPLGTGLPDKQPFAGMVQCDTNYARLLVASNGMYHYPGSSGTLNPARLLPLALLLLFFILLYYFFVYRRRLGRRSTRSENEQPEQPASNSS